MNLQKLIIKQKKVAKHRINNFKGKINTFWPSLIGEFQNENHEQVKNDLLNYFNEYEKKIQREMNNFMIKIM